MPHGDQTRQTKRGPRPPEPTATVVGGRRPTLSLSSLGERAATYEPAKQPVPLMTAGLFLIAGVVGVATMLRPSSTVDQMEGLANGAVIAEGAPNGSSQASGPSSGAPGPASAAAPPPERASGPELDEARAMGIARLIPLTERYPKDGAVQKALALAYAADSPGSLAAVKAIKRLFEVAPAQVEDDEIRRVILRAANGTPEAMEAAFDVMTHMGAVGPDLLYELVVAPGIGKLPKDKASAALQDPEIEKLETPALRIANQLRVAPACKRKPLLEPARQHGDARALHYLKPMQSTSGCGLFRSSDCFGCLGSRKELNLAIDAITARLPKPAASATP